MILMYSSKYILFPIKIWKLSILWFKSWTSQASHHWLNVRPNRVLHDLLPILFPSNPSSHLSCLASCSQTHLSHCSFPASKTLSSFLPWHLLFLPPGTFWTQILIHSGLFLIQVLDQMLGSLSIHTKPATTAPSKSLPVFAPWLFPSNCNQKWFC